MEHKSLTIQKKILCFFNTLLGEVAMVAQFLLHFKGILGVDNRLQQFPVIRGSIPLNTIIGH